VVKVFRMLQQLGVAEQATEEDPVEVEVEVDIPDFSLVQ
tara:strand:+ start:160 stop:276 length:117 start_codon:yes stop_codon:yes gene_type:complete